LLNSIEKQLAAWSEKSFLIKYIIAIVLTSIFL
jgi:hypothetical protein